MCCLSPQDKRFIYPEHGGSRSLQNVGNDIPEYTVSHPRKQNPHSHHLENFKSHRAIYIFYLTRRVRYFWHMILTVMCPKLCFVDIIRAISLQNVRNHLKVAKHLIWKECCKEHEDVSFLKHKQFKHTTANTSSNHSFQPTHKEQTIKLPLHVYTFMWFWTFVTTVYCSFRIIFFGQCPSLSG